LYGANIPYSAEIKAVLVGRWLTPGRIGCQVELDGVYATYRDKVIR
jgi:hypothetical protein